MVTVKRGRQRPLQLGNEQGYGFTPDDLIADVTVDIYRTFRDGNDLDSLVLGFKLLDQLIPPSRAIAQRHTERKAIARQIEHPTEGGQFTAYACQHLHGGIGIDVDYPLHRYFIWSTQLEHSLGCARDQLQQLGASIAERGIISADVP